MEGVLQTCSSGSHLTKWNCWILPATMKMPATTAAVLLTAGSRQVRRGLQLLRLAASALDHQCGPSRVACPLPTVAASPAPHQLVNSSQ
jgi:hypothetical protein